MVSSLEYKEFNKIAYKYTPTSIYNALCATYKGNQQIKEAKVNMLRQGK